MYIFFFFFQAEDGIRDLIVTGVQTCALPICGGCSTVEYRYHAQADGRGPLFRYCSPHGSGHRPCHHVHRYDIFDTWAELFPVEEIWDGNAVPTLSDVIEEVRDKVYYCYEF